ncbi:hypothetical protein CCAX7_60170 [Capsulimonas corticalis]|uniref:Uncharacterized protein n=1 Tax=Capsulimonas corticalis TaxID=2219043 RepID=A0A402CVU7_9BACT|nr:PAS domain-containing protein [Capsulimonas corticalis]BDI33966.1 hypothetical protein CCAX7_60170 [Capsulimonas corticalis]
MQGKDAQEKSSQNTDGDIASERLRRLADNAPLLIGYVDMDGRYLFNNHTYTDWFGVDTAGIHGKEIKEVIGEVAYQAVKHHLQAALSGEVVNDNIPMNYASAGRRFVRTTLIPDKDDSGAIRGVMLFITDDTALREAQDHMIAAYNRLVLVSNIGRAVRSAADPQAIMEMTTAALGETLDADRCYYVTYDLQRDRSIVGPEWRREGVPSISGEHRTSDYSPNRDKNYLAGQTNVIEDAFQLPDSTVARTLGLRAVVRAPIQQEGQMTVLVVAMASEPRQWTDQEISLVETTVSQTRGAVEAAHAAVRERIILRDVLSSVTEGKLNLINSRSETPSPAALVGEAICLTTSAGLHDLRRLCEKASKLAGHTEARTFDLMTAGSEAGMNALVHAGGGTATVRMSDQGQIQVWVEDQGAGIATMNLPKATLSRGYSTQGTLGHGLKMMLETCDRIYLLTGPSGTTIVLEQERETPTIEWL